MAHSTCRCLSVNTSSAARVVLETVVALCIPRTTHVRLTITKNFNHDTITITINHSNHDTIINRNSFVILARRPMRDSVSSLQLNR